MMTTALGALLSHWRRRPLQLATLVMGLALATALWSAVEAINGEARASYARAAAVLGQDQLRYLASRDGGRLTQAQYLDLRRGGWLVSPLLDGEWRAGSISLRLLGSRSAHRAAAGRDRRRGGRGVSAVLHHGTRTVPRQSGDGGTAVGREDSAARALREDPARHCHHRHRRGAATARRRGPDLAPAAGARAAPVTRAAGNRRTRAGGAPAGHRCGSLAPHRQLPSQPHGLCGARLRGWALHRACCHRPCLRTAPPGVPHAARARRPCPRARAAAGRRVAGLRAHRRAGGRRHRAWPGGTLASGRFGNLARTLWRRGARHADTAPGRLAGRSRHCPARRLRVGGARLLAGLATAAAGACAAARPGCGRASHRPGFNPSRPLFSLRRPERSGSSPRASPGALPCWPACFWLPR